MSPADGLWRPVGVRLMLLTAGIVGWAAFGLLTWQMYQSSPSKAGFDLELLIAGGRSMAAGASPYEAGMLGSSVGIADLFYSYPPIVAQFFSLFVSLPPVAIFGAAIAGASVAATLVGRAVAAAFGSEAVGQAAVLPLAALLPFWFPYTVGMLFGNIDIFFPALYGLVLLAAVRPNDAPRSRSWEVAGALALTLAAIIKLHPAILGLWLVSRGSLERRRGDDLRQIGPVLLPPSWRIALVATVAVAVVLSLSVAIGGLQPWFEYVTLLRTGTAVDLLDTRNLGPAAQLVLFLGFGPSFVAPIQLAILAVVVVATVAAAVRINDPLLSVACAAAASLVVLPVTWFHHFAALLPFGVAAIARGAMGDAWTKQRRWILLVAAFGIPIIGFAELPTWLLVPILFAAIRLSQPRESPRLERASVGP